MDRNYFRFNPGKEGKFGLKKHNLSGNPVHSRLSSKKTLDSIRLTHKFKKSMNNKTEKRNKRKRIVLDAWSDYQSPILEKQQCEIKYHNKIKNNIRNYQDNTSTLPKNNDAKTLSSNKENIKTFSRNNKINMSNDNLKNLQTRFFNYLMIRLDCFGYKNCEIGKMFKHV